MPTEPQLPATFNQSATNTAKRSPWFDRATFALFLISLALCSLVGGAYLAEFKSPVYEQTLQKAFRGLHAIEEQRTSDWTIDGWYVARDTRSGVVTHQSGQCYEGLTLFTSLGTSTSASLIDMQGRMVHQWRLPFREVWPEPPHRNRVSPEDRIHWRRVLVYPNGDLLANYTGIADTPDGYGFVKVDRDSKLLWKYTECAHHDFDVADDGKIYTLVHRIRQEPEVAAPHLQTPLLEDAIVELSSEGKELRRVRLFDAFANSSFQPYLDSMDSSTKGDHTHANTAHLIGPEYAARNPYCKPGDVMVSLRNPSLLAIVDLDRRAVVWAARGIWERQHDCDPLPNGNILLFDNKGRRAPGGRSRSIEWNPNTGAIVWQFAGTAERPFESLARSSQQVLPNDNVLITESNNGRLLEVTRAGQIVWEYINPDRFAGHPERIAVVCSALRYRPEELPFLKTNAVAKRSDADSQQPDTATSLK